MSGTWAGWSCSLHSGWEVGRQSWTRHVFQRHICRGLLPPTRLFHLLRAPCPSVSPFSYESINGLIHWWGRVFLIQTVRRITRLEPAPAKIAFLTGKSDRKRNCFQSRWGSGKISPRSCRTHIHALLVAVRWGLLWYPTSYPLFPYVYSLYVSQSQIAHVFVFLTMVSDTCQARNMLCLNRELFVFLYSMT